MTLGAREGFERGILRILFASKEPPILEDSAHAGTFRPSWEDFDRKTDEWNKIEKKARTCSGLRELFQKFKIESLPEGSEWVARLKSAWDNRNLIVHGSEPVRFSYSQFLILQL
jgi:hypothetical protein